VSVVLGLNEFFHDTAAALVVDGKLVSLIEQERLDRRKHSPGFALMGPPPREAIDWCLRSAGLAYREVDVIAVSFDIDAVRALGVLFDLLYGNRRRSSLRSTLHNRRSLHDPALDFVAGLTLGVRRRRAFLKDLAAQCQAEVVPVHHHLAHAASAYYPSGWDESAIIVVDGMGDATPTSLWQGRGSTLRLRHMVPSPQDSLGVLYRTVSLALGFSFMSAGKTMGLSAYGTPREPFTDMLVADHDRYRIDWKTVKRAGGRHGRSSGPLQQCHKDMAASVQRQLELAGCALARRATALAGSRNVALAGGVALNCNMNTEILRLEEVDEVFVQPGAMDMGCALGAALWEAGRRGDEVDRDWTVFTGPKWSDSEIEQALRARNLTYRRVEDPAVAGARLLAEREVIGWFQGRMEFGPRALGARSILANPDRVETRDRVNRIKQREDWRPLAPAVLEDRLDDWFVGAVRSPFMTLTFPFRTDRRDQVPAVVHVDGTARIQSVGPDDLPIYHRIITEFDKLTGIPILMNTSFNRRGEPIVCSPAEAVDTFVACGMDHLVAGPFVADQPGEVVL